MMTVIFVVSGLLIVSFPLLRIDVYRNVAKQRAAEKEAEEQAKKEALSVSESDPSSVQNDNTRVALDDLIK